MAGECARRSDRAETVVPALTANLKVSADLIGNGVTFTKAARRFHDMLVGELSETVSCSWSMSAAAGDQTRITSTPGMAS